MNSSSGTKSSFTDLDHNLAGKVITGLVVCMAIFFNAFVFLVALFSKRLRKSGYNLTTISLSFTDFLVGVSIRPLISYMANTYSVSFNSCTVALAGYTTCIQASSFHVLIIGFLRCYAIGKNSFTVFKFELRNAILVIFITWFLALFSTGMTFFTLTRKNVPFILCTLESVFGDEHKLFLKLHSTTLVACGLLLITMNLIVGCKLYARQTWLRRIFPINIEYASELTRTKDTVHNDDVSNSSLVTVREMTISKDENEAKGIEYHEQNLHKSTIISTSSKCKQFLNDPVRRSDNSKDKSKGKLNIINDTENIPRVSQNLSSFKDTPNFHTSSKTLVFTLDSVQSDGSGRTSVKVPTDRESSQDTKAQKPESSDSVMNKPLTINPITLRHKKSLITVSIIILLHLALNGPFYFFLFAEGFLMEDSGDAIVRTILFCISTLHSVFNPLVYVVRIPGFREFIKDKVNSFKKCVSKGEI